MGLDTALADAANLLDSLCRNHLWALLRCRLPARRGFCLGVVGAGLRNLHSLPAAFALAMAASQGLASPKANSTPAIESNDALRSVDSLFDGVSRSTILHHSSSLLRLILKHQTGFPDRDLVAIPKPAMPAGDLLTVDRYLPASIYRHEDVITAVATNICLNGSHSFNDDIAGGAASDGDAIIQLHHRSSTTVAYN